MPIFWYFMSLVNQSQLCGQSYTVCFGAGHRLAGKGSLNFLSVRGLNAYEPIYWFHCLTMGPANHVQNITGNPVIIGENMDKALLKLGQEHCGKTQNK
jgi:hypothetical protein